MLTDKQDYTLDVWEGANDVSPYRKAHLALSWETYTYYILH